MPVFQGIRIVYNNLPSDLNICLVNIKWQKEKYLDIECDTDQSPDIFKALLFSLTCVAPDRQKVMMPGGILKSTWDGIRVKDGITIMMMGSADELPSCSAAIVQTKFVEDMTEGQINRALKLPQGLANIGNTCYMNATIQYLRCIPELSKAMQCLPKIPETDKQKKFVLQLSNLFKLMDAAENSLNPYLLLTSLHTMCPQFASMQPVPAEQGGGNILMQQDANECFVEVMRSLSKSLELPTTLTCSNIPESFGASGGWNFVEHFLSGRFDVQTINTENDTEKSVSQEPFLQLSCFIDKEVKYLQTGIRNGLEGSLTKYSESLSRDAVFKRSSRISRLPAYLSVQFVRFYYKEKEKINAKVLKDVKFPIELDMFEFCTEDLQDKLLAMREKFKTMEDKKANTEKERKTGKVAVEDKEKEEVNENYPYWFTDDIGSNNSGLYELRAVLTHQGRSSSSGHYLGWVRYRGDVWMKYDDDQVSQVTSEDILRLSGGGDWHCAYLLMYGPRLIEVDRPHKDNGDVVTATVNQEPMDANNTLTQ